MNRPYFQESSKPAEHLAPASRAAGTYTSTAVNQVAADQPAFEDALIIVHVGGYTSNPSAFTLDVKLQQGATSTPTTDVAGKSVHITAAGIYEIPFSPGDLKQYYRVHATPAFTGGSSPELFFSVLEIRTGSDQTPC